MTGSKIETNRSVDWFQIVSSDISICWLGFALGPPRSQSGRPANPQFFHCKPARDSCASAEGAEEAASTAQPIASGPVRRATILVSHWFAGAAGGEQARRSNRPLIQRA